MINKVIPVKEAVEKIPDGATIMFGGFMGCGNAHRLIGELAGSGKGGFTIISNDASMPGGPIGDEHYGIAKLIHNRQVKKLIATHVGLNPEVAAQEQAGELELVLIPQGSFAEMIRAGGAGLGGVLTPTGVGTLVEENPYAEGRVAVDGRDYLLMKPLTADIAIIAGYYVDKIGNVWYKGTMRNFSAVMATAADVVIAEAAHIVEVGDIVPENVMTSSIFVDYVVPGLGGA
ncbi:MAG: 3-oxoacid CoA-transferase subunit A [Clostridiales Family XIII bacterium]|jgi:acetate CoA/acetoacetate CoA-transferase alpha subunit|nr:3-oxoacid CoA-transferase subunit A [Clostridiales Family XIII bacterium]